MSAVVQLPSVPIHANARLLIVDDEPANVQLLERILGNAGYSQLSSATDPRDVMNRISQVRPDIVLLDLLMPHVDGFAVMAQIRAGVPNGADLPILVLTADMTPEAKQRSLLQGANDFLTKPFDRTEALLRIGNLLDNHFLHQELADERAALEDKVAERTKELAETIEELQRVDAERRRLLEHLVAAQENERGRLASDVHDGPIQRLTVAGLKLDRLRLQLTGQTSPEAVDELKVAVQTSVRALRQLVFELRPPSLDVGGLAVTLREYLESVRAEFGLEYRFESRLSSEPPVGTSATMYRIAQEAITNTRKHATATCIRLLLETLDAGVHLRIEDDGVGFSTAIDRALGDGGLGEMRERAELVSGTLTIESAPGAGTAIDLTVP